jgi:hypothetical protein
MVAELHEGDLKGFRAFVNKNFQIFLRIPEDVVGG